MTKREGTLFVAYCNSDAHVIGTGFKIGNAPAMIELGLLDPVTFKTIYTPAELFERYRKEDINELMTRFPVTRLHYVATDLFTNHMRETIDAMDDAMFELYLKYHFSVCEREDMVGVTHHSLDVFKKDK